MGCFLTFPDNYSKWTKIYFFCSKDEVNLKFLEFENLVENQTGRKFRALSSDNGGEFCNTEMGEILRKFGIKRRLTTSHTPQQNGVAERKKSNPS